MTIITLIVFLLFFLLVGVGGVERERAVTPTVETQQVAVATPGARERRKVAGDGYAGVIVAEDEADDFVRGAGWEPAGAYWTPLTIDVAALEAEIDDAWVTAAPPHARDEDLSGHLRQYVGTIEASERLILVNGFCDPLDTDWESEPVVVQDGGTCYFQAIWEVERAEFRSLTVNGEA